MTLSPFLTSVVGRVVKRRIGGVYSVNRDETEGRRVSMQDWDKLAEALKIAWAALPADERARLEPEIRREHDALLSIRDGVAPSSPPRPELALAYSLLHDDP
ncbi:MAG TPA: hypothetical protein VIH92_05895, partial [Solirubrobacteraceae bacterium]